MVILFLTSSLSISGLRKTSCTRLRKNHVQKGILNIVVQKCSSKWYLKSTRKKVFNLPIFADQSLLLAGRHAVFARLGSVSKAVIAKISAGRFYVALLVSICRHELCEILEKLCREKCVDKKNTWS